MDSSLQTLKPGRGHMGTMYFWGSISERVHGTIGYIHGMDLGYTKKMWTYDDRLQYEAPPLFPPKISRSGRMRFAVLSWKRKY
jgi:hypothetical protein